MFKEISVPFEPSMLSPSLQQVKAELSPLTPFLAGGAQQGGQRPVATSAQTQEAARHQNALGSASAASSSDEDSGSAGSEEGSSSSEEEAGSSSDEEDAAPDGAGKAAAQQPVQGGPACVLQST